MITSMSGNVQVILIVVNVKRQESFLEIAVVDVIDVIGERRVNSLEIKLIIHGSAVEFKEAVQPLVRR